MNKFAQVSPITLVEPFDNADAEWTSILGKSYCISLLATFIPLLSRVEFCQHLAFLT